ncbi:MAG: DUF2062 domain-containing protein [Burkholderiales bacterium]|nr:DUF2062 domain-containing protein [Burkholderiales bacterium]
MPRKFFRKYLPNHETVRNNRHMARFGGFLRHPNLWHLNRHSVAGGLAVGMFSGLVPGPLQMLTAALLAVPLRVNLPVALATTLYTNPITIGPLYVLAYLTGRMIIGGVAAPLNPPPEFDWSQWGTSLDAFVHWALAMGMPLAVGLPTLALMLAALGYFCVQIGWRAYVIRAWRRRRLLRRSRLNPD